MKCLQVVETAYRATLEEQDDPVVWICHAMKGAGADLGVLLRSGAVNYAVTGQDPSGLAFGDWAQKHPPDLQGDLRALMEKRVPVYLVMEDAMERGLDPETLLEGIQLLSWSEVPALMEDYDQVWHW
ncbi:MAG: hypothetical protein DWQ01_19325 [Planctomycetota bacterium]|nr:MAG: hypothetical protein DWQ01_19325 [Planctomycetota bacterium]